MNKQIPKLALNKETLRDLTAQKAGDVKAGTIFSGKVGTCIFTFFCKGNTRNKKCGY